MNTPAGKTKRAAGSSAHRLCPSSSLLETDSRHAPLPKVTARMSRMITGYGFHDLPCFVRLASALRAAAIARSDAPDARKSAMRAIHNLLATVRRSARRPGGRSCCTSVQALRVMVRGIVSADSSSIISVLSVPHGPSLWPCRQRNGD